MKISDINKRYRHPRRLLSCSSQRSQGSSLFIPRVGWDGGLSKGMESLACSTCHEPFVLLMLFLSLSIYHTDVLLPEDTDQWYWLQLVLSVIVGVETITGYGGNFLGSMGVIQSLESRYMIAFQKPWVCGTSPWDWQDLQDTFSFWSGTYKRQHGNSELFRLLFRQQPLATESHLTLGVLLLLPMALRAWQESSKWLS